MAVHIQLVVQNVIIADSMKLSGIYKFQSISLPDRVYVGSTLDLRQRESAHRTSLQRNKHENGKLQNHVNKYGIDDLEFEVIESGDYVCKNHRLAREQIWIDRYKYHNTELPYFNIVPIAGSCQGRTLSEETKKKIGEKSRNLPRETRKIIANKLKGRKRSAEIVKNNSLKHMGKKHKSETIEKMKGKIPWNKGKRGYKLNLTEEQRQKRRDNAIGSNYWEDKKLSAEHIQHIKDGWTRRRENKIKILTNG